MAGILIVLLSFYVTAAHAIYYMPRLGLSSVPLKALVCVDACLPNSGLSLVSLQPIFEHYVPYHTSEAQRY